MDANTLLSTCILVGGIYGIFSFYPATGKHLFPSVYLEQDGRSARRYAILFTGIFCTAAGFYGLAVQPLFN
jgi:hypothetical protein